MLHNSPPKKGKSPNKANTVNSSLDDSLKNLMKFAQSEYGLENQGLRDGNEKSTEEMIDIIKKKLADFQDSVKVEQQNLIDIKRECKFMQDALQSSKKLKQKSIGQDYLSILTAEATNEFFASRVNKLKDDYENIQNLIDSKKEMIEISNRKIELDKELTKKDILIASLEKSISMDEKSLENQIKKYESVKEKDEGLKGEFEALKSEIKELRNFKKEIEDESREIEDNNLKEKLKSFLNQNTIANEEYEQELGRVNERITRVKNKISQIEEDILILETEMIAKKREKVEIIEAYIAVTNKFEEKTKSFREENTETLS